MTEPITLAFVTQMPSPYMRDLFAAMHADGRVRPHVFYMEAALPDAYWKAPRLESWETILPGGGFNILRGRLHWNPGIIPALRDAAADMCVLSGYSSLTTQLAARHLTRCGRPWILFAERPGVRARRLPGRTLRAIGMSSMLHSASSVAAVGSSAVDAYHARCPNSTPIYNIPYFTNTAPFRAAPARSGKRSGEFRILYCGQLIKRKGVDLLVQAFLSLAARHEHLRLDLVGEGPLRDALQQMIPAALRDRAVFHGFSPVEELPGHFSRADLFVLPSRHDGWGVVINQALAAGLPVVASDAVGAARDYVAGRGTGWIVPAGQLNALIDGIAHFLREPSRLRECSAKASLVANELSLERGVDAWISAFQTTLARHAAATSASG